MDISRAVYAAYAAYARVDLRVRHAPGRVCARVAIPRARGTGGRAKRARHQTKNKKAPRSLMMLNMNRASLITRASNLIIQLLFRYVYFACTIKQVSCLYLVLLCVVLNSKFVASFESRFARIFAARSPLQPRWRRWLWIARKCAFSYL